MIRSAGCYSRWSDGTQIYGTLVKHIPEGDYETTRTHILLPQALLRDIDRMVGPRGRSAFLVETAQEEVKSRKLLQFLENDEPAWKDGDHPRDERRFGGLGTRAA